MSAEYFLVCEECKKAVLATKRRRLVGSPEQIAEFIEDHAYECDGRISVIDEEFITSDIEKFEG